MLQAHADEIAQANNAQELHNALEKLSLEERLQSGMEYPLATSLAEAVYGADLYAISMDLEHLSESRRSFKLL